MKIPTNKYIGLSFEYGANLSLCCLNCAIHVNNGGLAQMVERPLCMREVPGSIPGFSFFNLFISYNFSPC